MRPQWSPAVLEAVGRASRRAAASVHEDLKDGLYDLATIASIAPWIGMLGTVVVFPDAFPAITGQRRSMLGYQFAHFAGWMAFAGLGLLVGLVAFWGYQCLSNSLDNLGSEMENASLELLNQLSRFPSRFTLDSAAEMPAAPPVRRDRLFRPCFFTGSAAVLLDFFVQAARFGLMSACFYMPFMLGTCCVLIYPFWSRLLRRPPGVLFALASLCVLAWSVTEAILGISLP